MLHTSCHSREHNQNAFRHESREKRPPAILAWKTLFKKCLLKISQNWTEKVRETDKTSLKDDQQHKYTEVTVSAWNRRTLLAYLQALFILGELIFYKRTSVILGWDLVSEESDSLWKKTVAWLQKSSQEWPSFINRLVYYQHIYIDKYIIIWKLYSHTTKHMYPLREKKAL